ncbi:T9SS type A sorting domain-containing protein [Chryseobacterium aahli]|uniref:Ig-like domain-containing protein n=1 Tax=Chryseobacterium aahli TaxID=1278643 RepID=UPI001F61C076|nr:T9SS type A sorting domain-containing protein [Chryseobacterium aahli]MCI3937379.1 T9SS type A sorting domain-containing protein [Chryseobacterium aahli]
MKQFYQSLFLKRKSTKIYLKSAVAGLAFLFAGHNTVHAQVSAYSFAQSSGTFTTISGTVLGEATGNTAATNLDSNVYPVTLPFAFQFNGTPQNNINVSSNGFITFGATAPLTSLTSPINASGNYDGVISAFGRDISSFFNVSGKSGKISWETVGTAPNREVVIQWENFRLNSATTVTSVFSFSFQIRLQETTNAIKIVYNSGSFLVGSTNVSGTVQIGLRGSTITDFNNRLNATTLEFVNSTQGTANSSTQAFNISNAIPGTPSAGLAYTWSPPSCFQPTGLTVNNITGNAASISWVASPSSPSGGYDIYYSTSNVAPISSTTPTISGFMGLTTTISSLASSTMHYVWIRSNCGSGNLSAWTLYPVLFNTECQSPTLTSTTGATVCPNQSATLSAVAPTGANVIWYDAPTGGNIVGTGSNFTTPVLASTTTYYATASTGSGTITTAKSTYTPNPSSGVGLANFGLLFDVTAPFTLKKVTIYPISSAGSVLGNVTIDVIDAAGTVVHTKTVDVITSPSFAPVAQVISLDFPMAVGTNYKLRPSAKSATVGNLLFDPSANATAGNFGFPYNVPGFLTINSSTLTAAPTNTPRTDLYYYFYDWKIGSGCESQRVAVTATVDSNCLSTSENEAKNVIKVYPNPFSEVVNVTKPELVKSVRVSDLSGKLIETINQPESVLRLNDLSAGMYLLQLDMKDGSKQTIKVIKK